MLASKSKTKNKNNIISTIRLILLCLLPSSLFFSYYPIFTIADTPTMNLELSLPLVILFLYALFSIIPTFHYLKSHKNALYTLIFPFYTLLSLLWTPNLLRGILTCGILLCIYLAIFGTIECCNVYNKKQLNASAYIFLITSAVVCLFCIAQCILDTMGVSRETTLLCLGCTSSTFGFPHPSGFAIEPQFMGNLLLLPSLLYVYGYINFRHLMDKKSHRIIFDSFVILCIFTLFLTFSRGAIYAFALGYALLLILSCAKRKSLFPAKSLIIVVLSFCLSLLSQGLMSQFSPYDCNFMDGISRSVSQLSLGIIEIRNPEKVEEKQEITKEKVEETKETKETKETPIFNGYVEESTDTRVLLNNLAISAWTNSPSSFIFGYGLGSSGVIINRFFPNRVDVKEIIQNELFTILLELGIFGLLSVLFCLFIIIKSLKKSPHFIFYLSAIISFVASLMFFSGLPNALHVYLFLPFLVCFLGKNKFVVGKISDNH